MDRRSLDGRTEEGRGSQNSYLDEIELDPGVSFEDTHYFCSEVKGQRHVSNLKTCYPTSGHPHFTSEQAKSSV